MSRLARRWFSVSIASAVLTVSMLAATAEANLLVSLRGPYSEGPNRVVLIDDLGNYLKDFVPEGSGGLQGPTGMQYGADGNLYVSSAFSNAILKYNGQTGAPLGVFSDGADGLNGPTGLTFGPDQNLYVTNFGSFGGTTISVLDPSSGNRVGLTGTFGTGHAGPTSIVFDAAGNAYVSEFALNAVNKYGPNGNLIKAITDHNMNSPTNISGPGGLAIQPGTNLLTIANVLPGNVLAYDDIADQLSIFRSVDSQFYPGGTYFTDGTGNESLIFSTAGGAILKYIDGNPSPVEFANFTGLDPSGVSIGSIVYTTALPDPCVWNVDASGDWTTNANWVGGSPNGAGLVAVFGGKITSPQTVTLDAAKTIGSIVFDNASSYTIAGASTLTISNAAGSGTINVLAGSHTISAPLAIAAGNTVIKDGPGQLTISGPQAHGAGAILTTAAGTTNIDTDGGVNLSINANATTNFGSSQHLAGLNVGPLATATLSSGGGKLLATSTLNVDATATLNLADNDLAVLATAGMRAAVLANVSGRIAAAFHGGLWDHSGITSSAAAGDTGHLTALGAILNDNGTGLPWYSTYDGQAVDVNSVLVKYTYYGDANLNGQVDGTDYALIDNGFNFSLSGWLNGDFNYDGHVDGTDYAFIDNAFNFQGGPLAVGTTSLQAVPEPSSIALLVFGAAGILVLATRRRSAR